jgi:hypothetical protein
MLKLVNDQYQVVQHSGRKEISLEIKVSEGFKKSKFQQNWLQRLHYKERYQVSVEHHS